MFACLWSLPGRHQQGLERESWICNRQIPCRRRKPTPVSTGTASTFSVPTLRCQTRCEPGSSRSWHPRLEDTRPSKCGTFGEREDLGRCRGDDPRRWPNPGRQTVTRSKDPLGRRTAVGEAPLRFLCRRWSAKMELFDREVAYLGLKLIVVV